MIYLSGHISSLRHPALGYILTPDMRNKIPSNTMVAADNACFSNPSGYSDEKYIKHLTRFPKERTLFATAPDVMGDHLATIARSINILRKIRSLGLKAAFVCQDGWEEKTTPWEEIDVIFIGGSTEFKFRGGRLAVKAAKKYGLWAHMGRVNSLERLRASLAIGCDSADGTFLRFGPDINKPKLLYWLNAIESQMEIPT